MFRVYPNPIGVPSDIELFKTSLVEAQWGVNQGHPAWIDYTPRYFKKSELSSRDTDGYITVGQQDMRIEKKDGSTFAFKALKIIFNYNMSIRVDISTQATIYNCGTCFEIENWDIRLFTKFGINGLSNQYEVKCFDKDDFKNKSGGYNYDTAVKYNRTYYFDGSSTARQPVNEGDYMLLWLSVPNAGLAVQNQGPSRSIWTRFTVTTI